MKDNLGREYSGRLFKPRKIRIVNEVNDYGRIQDYVEGEALFPELCKHNVFKEALEKCKAIQGPKDIEKFVRKYGYIRCGDPMAINEETKEPCSLYYRWAFTLNWLQALVAYLENPSTDEYVTFEKTELTDQQLFYQWWRANRDGEPDKETFYEWTTRDDMLADPNTSQETRDKLEALAEVVPAFQPAVLVLPSDKFLDQFPNADRSLLGGQYYDADWKYRWWWRFAIPWNGKVEPRFYKRYVEKTLALYFESPDYNVRLPDVHATVEVAFKKGKPSFNLFMRTLGEGMLNAFFDEWETSKYSRCEKCGRVAKRERQSKRFCSDACRKAFSRSNNL